MLGRLLSQLSDSCENATPIITECGAAFEQLGRSKDIETLTLTFTTTIDRLLEYTDTPTTDTSTINHLERAKAYINEHLEEDLKVAQVAHSTGVRPQQLQQLFKKALIILLMLLR